MNTERIVWTILFVLGGALLIGRATMSKHGMAKAYVSAEHKQFVEIEKPAAIPGEAPEKAWVRLGSDQAKELNLTPNDVTHEYTTYSAAQPSDYHEAEQINSDQQGIVFSLWRTIGIWIAAFFTLAIFSFLYKDNPFYKVAECVLVGVSAAYWMVVGFWDVIVPNLIGRLAPGITKATMLPGLAGKDTEPNYWYIVPLVLGIMLLWRLAPKGNWIARWPLAFIIGTTAGIRLTGFIHADFLSQISATVIPLYVETTTLAADGSIVMDAAGNPVMTFDIWDSIANIIIVIGVLACLVYFFFSFEHKGIVGKTARLGIWFLMITFGAAFGYTVMGRIALLAIRLEFLFYDWLWFGNKAVASLMQLLISLVV